MAEVRGASISSGTSVFAVHYHPETGAPLGVWRCPSGGEPVCVYLVAEAENIGRGDIDLRGSGRSWEDFTVYLAERSPYTAWWERLEVAANTDPAMFLRGLATEWAERRWHSKIALVAGSLAETRYRFAADRARRLALAVGGPGDAFLPPHRISTRLCLFADAARLVVVVGPQEPADAVGIALAHGLAYAGDRDLGLVLPAGTETATLMRAPWIEVPLQVWTYDAADEATFQVLPARADVLGSYTDEVVTAEHALSRERAEWVTDLREWADKNPNLVPAHRPSYLAWHCRGRLVLRIARAGALVEVRAGVQHTKPTDDRPAPLVERVAGPLRPDVMADIVRAAETAIEHRLEGTDAENAEHALQAVMAREPALLGLVEMRREFPAFRPADPLVRSYMDFLGVDGKGRLHVVETKIGHDEMLVLQGLDYWIWAYAHRRALARMFGLGGTPEVVIDFVTADPSQRYVVGPYTASQAEALDGSVAWRFHHVTGWTAGQPAIESGPSRVAPEPAQPPRLTGPRHSVALGRWLADSAHAGGPLRGRVFLADIRDGVVAAALPALEELAERGLLHQYAAHTRSSQLFALNLFGPLGRDGARSILARFDPRVVEAEPPMFEYRGPGDPLGERTPGHDHVTQVDVLLRGRTSDGEAHAALVEVKLSEVDFGHCSAYENPANDSRDVCCVSAPFGGDPQRCFQLRSNGGPARRRYDDFVAVPHLAVPASQGCPFRLGGNQAMRNVALARWLLASGDAVKVTYGLCAPEDNLAIWRRWAAIKELFAVSGVELVDLPAHEVLSHHHHDDVGALADRYRIDIARVRDAATNRFEFGLQHALSILQRVGGEGSILEQIAQSCRWEKADLADLVTLADALAVAAEQARHAREIASRVWTAATGHGTPGDG